MEPDALGKFVDHDHGHRDEDHGLEDEQGHAIRVKAAEPVDRYPIQVLQNGAQGFEIGQAK